MTPEAFTTLIDRLAPGARVRLVMDTVRFCIGAKAFATLNWPGQGWAVLKLADADQKRVLARSGGFTRERGRRRSGVTLVRLEAVSELDLADAIAAAWRYAYGAPGLRAPIHDQVELMAKAG
jgi:hypothetical protein